MKSLICSSLVFAVAALAGCQSTGMAQSDSRRVDLAGAQSQQSFTVPASPAAPDAQAPYALQGSSASGFNAPMGMGYQAR